MTKPIVGAAMMMLWEQGKWTLDDPVAKHIPEFAGLKVATPNGEVSQTTPMTMRQLMSHTAGFDVNAGYAKLNLPERDKPLQAFIDKLATLPRAAQPGTDFRYGPSVDIQGYIVEQLSGQTLDVFLRTKIFEPLGMKDAGFWLPSKVDRVTSVFTDLLRPVVGSRRRAAVKNDVRSTAVLFSAVFVSSAGVHPDEGMGPNTY